MKRSNKYTKKPFAEDTLEDVNRLRRAVGLEEIAYTNKTCMSCGRVFESEGRHNRMCVTCRSRSSAGSGA